MKTPPVISVAPMMDWTDRHCRYFHRLLAPSIVLYTEMITANAIIHGNAARHLDYNPEEHPVVLQLGGSDPAALAQAVTMAEPYGYDAYNLNCGCPSDRVQNGAFGACLMAEPDRVAECVKAMQSATDRPVTVKCRFGIDDADPGVMTRDFIASVSSAGCETFIVHARKAWLQGLSPKENRDIPPLDYGLVSAIKRENPHLQIHLNGGITTAEQVQTLTDEAAFDGFMIGRAAYHNPEILSVLEREWFSPDHKADYTRIINDMIAYANCQAESGVPIASVTRHMINLFQGRKGARQWRRILSEQSRYEKRAEDVLIPAYQAVSFE